ncbi:hypothetical protein E2I00_014740 [Balaenoptera physalus]|uniref:Uncharacterized protein n=1 Tax=Balaenoptera physalus TaxID=9770 RepID=A0A6A1Q5Y3_BALPH|nr:hypothetical protein E2I00_014740 [Balaenoptera physalus]
MHTSSKLSHIRTPLRGILVVGQILVEKSSTRKQDDILVASQTLGNSSCTHKSIFQLQYQISNTTGKCEISILNRFLRFKGKFFHASVHDGPIAPCFADEEPYKGLVTRLVTHNKRTVQDGTDPRTDPLTHPAVLQKPVRLGQRHKANYSLLQYPRIFKKTVVYYITLFHEYTSTMKEQKLGHNYFDA